MVPQHQHTQIQNIEQGEIIEQARGSQIHTIDAATQQVDTGQRRITYSDGANTTKAAVAATAVQTCNT